MQIFFLEKIWQKKIVILLIQKQKKIIDKSNLIY